MIEIEVDSFAGGGGASTGIEAATRRPVAVAVNHDAQAIAMHAANHPETQHLIQSVWRMDPRDVARGRPVGLAWFSPDCKHFSKAKGGKPVEHNIRDLAWVVVHWARLVSPRIILLENVEEFKDWGPLIETEDGKKMPCPLRRGFTYRRWKRELVKLGYQVEERELRACDYGAPTSRKRLFVIARRDGLPIVWPAPTHGPGRARPYRVAADIIDWSIPCPSIFERDRPLAENTMRRIAMGVKRYVIDSAKPFIIPVTHAGDSRVHGIDEPLRTLTCAPRGEHALVTPFIAPRYGERAGQEPRTHAGDGPLPTIVPSANGARLVAAFLAQHNGGMVGHAAEEPVSTICHRGTQQAVVAAHMMVNTSRHPGRSAEEPTATVATGGHHAVVTSHVINLKGSDRRDRSADEPVFTQTSGGWHIGEVRAFLLKYYGTDQDPRIDEPLDTLTTKARFGLVTVHGVEYQIVDIGMRMLTPRELFRAQGFPDDYVIAPEIDGVPLTKTAQIRCCGNSVCPPVAEALVRANYEPQEIVERPRRARRAAAVAGALL